MCANDWERLEKSLAFAFSSSASLSEEMSRTADDGLLFVPIVLEQAHELRYEALARQAHLHVGEGGLVEECVRLLPAGLEDSALARHAGYREALEYLRHQWLTSFPKSKQSRRRGLDKLVQMYFRALRLQSDKHWKLLNKSLPLAPRVRVDNRSPQDVTKDIRRIWERALTGTHDRGFGIYGSDGSDGSDGSADIGVADTGDPRVRSSPTLATDGNMAIEYLQNSGLEQHFIADKERALHMFMQGEGIVPDDEAPRVPVDRHAETVNGRLSKGQKRAKRWRERQMAADDDTW